jgi:hypothetical protein
MLSDEELARRKKEAQIEQLLKVTRGDIGRAKQVGWYTSSWNDADVDRVVARLRGAPMPTRTSRMPVVQPPGPPPVPMPTGEAPGPPPVQMPNLVFDEERHAELPHPRLTSRQYDVLRQLVTGVTTTLMLANPLSAVDAQKLGLAARAYAINEQIVVEDWAAKALIRTGYGAAIAPTSATMIIGDGPPYPGLGGEGAWYLDKLNQLLWGPKASGLWPIAIRPGRGIVTAAVTGATGSKHLILTMTDGATIDAGLVG